VRKSRFALAQRFIGGAFLCGLAFAVSKAIEYTEKLNAGISLLTNDFFMYYFTLTGIHLFHVIAGSIVLLVQVGGHDQRGDRDQPAVADELQRQWRPTYLHEVPHH
jgi:heme/copper-type cytochrome/quinol oxidase subunit 3